MAHSLSPVLHRAAYTALGLTGWTYDAIDCGADDVAALLDGCAPEWVGFSVTMPAKRAALAAADAVSPIAAAVGAANTLLREGGAGWRADNTDVAGIRAALGDRVEPGAAVALLGAGGTAQAAVVALHGLGVGSVDVFVRDPCRTGDLRATAERCGAEVHIRRLDETTLLTRTFVVISTLPTGAADPLAALTWGRPPLLLDAVYAPWPTALARAVTATGGTVVGGREILVHQAAAQVRLMTGRTAPLPAMRAALDAVSAA